MSYGINVINSYGNLTISEDYRNFHRYSSGTTANSGTLPTTGPNELLLIRPTSDVGGHLVISNNKVYSNTGAVEWAIVKENPPATSEIYGLKVFGSGGNVSFNSGYPAVCPVSTIRINCTYNTDNVLRSGTYNLPFSTSPTRKRYILNSCLTLNGFMDPGINAPYQPCSTKVIFNSNTNITVGEVVLSEYTGPYLGGYGDAYWGQIIYFAFIDA